MPRGDKSKYTDKQKRQAEHIEQGYEKKGVGEGEAAKRAWATVNKTTGGGEKSGSGRTTSAASKRSAKHESAENAADARKGRSHYKGQGKTRRSAANKKSSTAKRSTAKKSTSKKSTSRKRAK